jgi:hypothetical protein
MDELPSGIDNMTMKEAIAWSMVIKTITSAPALFGNISSYDAKLELIIKLYSKLTRLYSIHQNKKLTIKLKHTAPFLGRGRQRRNIFPSSMVELLLSYPIIIQYYKINVKHGCWYPCRRLLGDVYCLSGT